MSWLELIAVLFSLCCTWLAVRKNVLNWPVGIIGTAAYFFVFYSVQLYADMLLQLVFISQGFYGWYNWKFGKQEKENIIVSSLSQKERLVYGFTILIATVCWCYALQKWTDASLPLADAFVSTLSLAANWLMARKKIENWILWIVADVLYVFLFLYKELYLSGALYVVFVIFATRGFIEWNKGKNINGALS